jgi:ElaB/YqjD/DUF883 family membrane-anchored ribosome-binding protein
MEGSSDVVSGRRGQSEHKIMEAVGGELQGLRDVGREYLERGKDKVLELEEGFEGRIQEHPIGSVLIAAGVGVVIGALLCRR